MDNSMWITPDAYNYSSELSEILEQYVWDLNKENRDTAIKNLRMKYGKLLEKPTVLEECYKVIFTNYKNDKEMFKQYRKKPIVVGAMLWEGTKEQKEFLSTNRFSDRDLNVTFGEDDSVSFNIYDNRLTVHKGKYIICGTKGELYPCKAGIFAELYDRVVEVDEVVIPKEKVGMDIKEYTSIQKQMIDFTLRVRQLEESMHTCVAFKTFGAMSTIIGDVINARFNSAVLASAHKELRNARMFCGDILRLLGIENPYKNAYTGELQQEIAKYMENGGLKIINWGADVLKEVPTDITHSNESLCLAYMKNALGNAKERSGLFYEFNDKLMDEVYVDYSTFIESYFLNEIRLYFNMMLAALKKANCYLGIRFSELV